MGVHRTEPCPSGRGPFPWLFSPAEPTDSRKITEQTQFACKTNYFNNLDDISEAKKRRHLEAKRAPWLPARLWLMPVSVPQALAGPALRDP